MKLLKILVGLALLSVATYAEESDSETKSPKEDLLRCERFIKSNLKLF